MTGDGDGEGVDTSEEVDTSGDSEESGTDSFAARVVLPLFLLSRSASRGRSSSARMMTLAAGLGSGLLPYFPRFGVTDEVKGRADETDVEREEEEAEELAVLSFSGPLLGLIAGGSSVGWAANSPSIFSFLIWRASAAFFLDGIEEERKEEKVTSVQDEEENCFLGGNVEGNGCSKKF